jgi:hypothetical protein
MAVKPSRRRLRIGAPTINVASAALVAAAITVVLGLTSAPVVTSGLGSPPGSPRPSPPLVGLPPTSPVGTPAAPLALGPAAGVVDTGSVTATTPVLAAPRDVLVGAVGGTTTRAATATGPAAPAISHPALVGAPHALVTAPHASSARSPTPTVSTHASDSSPGAGGHGSHGAGVSNGAPAPAPTATAAAPVGGAGTSSGLVSGSSGISGNGHPPGAGAIVGAGSSASTGAVSHEAHAAARGGPSSHEHH